MKKIAKALLVVGVLGGLLFPKTASAVARGGPGGEGGSLRSAQDSGHEAAGVPTCRSPGLRSHRVRRPRPQQTDWRFYGA